MRDENIFLEDSEKLPSKMANFLIGFFIFWMFYLFLILFIDRGMIKQWYQIVIFYLLLVISATQFYRLWGRDLIFTQLLLKNLYIMMNAFSFFVFFHKKIGEDKNISNYFYLRNYFFVKFLMSFRKKSILLYGYLFMNLEDKDYNTSSTKKNLIKKYNRNIRTGKFYYKLKIPRITFLIHKVFLSKFFGQFVPNIKKKGVK